jgi:hypothetical protein
MPSKTSRQPLERTSVQLTRQHIALLDESWPTLNRSEALRLVIDRYIYLENAAAPRAYHLVHKYLPVFEAALRDLSCDAFRVAASSLPAIVMAAMEKQDVRDAAEKEMRLHGDPIDWKQLETEIVALDPLARIRALDCTVEERHREQEREGLAASLLTS